MTMLSAPRLHEIIDAGVITCEDIAILHKNTNSASIDVRIGNKILVEAKPRMDEGLVHFEPVDLEAKKTLNFVEVIIPEEGYVIQPGQCFLASTMETFNLPDTISCRFDLRSSIGRNFLEHMQAGFADAGWHGAQLTMEFKNVTQHHRLLIKPGMRVGQMIFFEHEPAGEDSYAIKGNYNKQQGPTKAFDGEGHK
ncbi:MAG: dCTP deaminase [Cetobacterium sp.]|uniref:dCTP deaminase n=1 Tax=Cetobacterium sp. TaxID=2071632 RepID=UPI003EE654D0